MKALKHPFTGAALVAVAAAALFALLGRSDVGGGALERLECGALDVRFLLRGKVAPSPDVVLLTFDDQTAERAGPLFERRAGWAQVIAKAKAAGAKVIGVDAVFDVPERLLGESLQARAREWARAHPEVPDDDTTGRLLRDIARELDGDRELEQALKDAGNVVLILFAGEGTRGVRDDPSLSRARYVQSTLGEVPPREVDTLVASLPELNGAAKALGFASVNEDETHTVRRLVFARRAEGAVYFPFVLPVVAAWLDVNRGRLAYLGPQHEVRLGDRSLALDHDALWLNYRGPAGSFTTLSVVDLMEGRLAPDALKGKMVLIGITRLGYDSARTPFRTMPGVEVQATAVDNVLKGDALVRTSHLTDALVTLGLGLLVSLVFLPRRLSLVSQVLGVLALVGGWLGVCVFAFSAQGRWLPVVAPLGAALASASAGLVLAYASESLQRRALRKAFGHYLGDDVLEELLADPSKLRLGGERRTLSVVFTDIRDFTTLSEKLAPEQLVAVLNTYLSPMTRAVLGQGGLLDKYIGDAVMAVFGAPVPRADHATQALACVLVMHAELEALNAGPLQALGQQLAIGAGVNTGDMVVGNMGSEERFDYTVAGDAVNLASRLEGLTKKYGVFCLVGDATRRAAGDGFTFRELDLVQVKGKHEAVGIHELLSGPSRTLARYEQLQDWERGLAAFRAGRLPEARAAFAAFRAANPKDAVVRLYLERLAELPEQAPEGFSAVAVFHTK